MKAPSETGKKVLAIIIIVNLCLLYIIGALHATMCGYPTWNPIKMIQCFFVFGFPTHLFVTVYLIALLLGGYLLFKFSREQGGLDVLGRAFHMNLARQTYGDTHFETPAEFKEIALVQSPKNAYGTILGQWDSSGEKLINQRMSNKRDNKHMMVIGASGTGKTYTFVKPYCFQCVKRRESVIITDPDGGLFRDMAGYFQDQGYVVRQLNLKDPIKSDGWDCLKTVQGPNAELIAQLFSHTVISNLVKDLDSIYGSGPMALLKACILRVVLGHDYPPEKKNIKSVYELLSNPAGEEFLETMFDINILEPEETPCLKPYLSYKTASPNLRGNLITNLSVQLQLLQSDLLCQVLSTDDMDLTLPGKQPCAYFCRFPDYHDTYKFIVSLFFSMLFIQLTEFADDCPGGRLPVPVNFLLDEFPSIGRIPDFDRKISTVRKRSMNICMILQDITQLQQERAYKDTWVTIMANCATLVSLGINDKETADLITKRIGETTVAVETQQHDAQESILMPFCRRSTGEGRRSLLSFEELYRVGVDDCLILAQRHNPIYAKKYPYILHPDAKKLREILPSDIPPITDIEARKTKREKENAYISAYLLKHPLNKVNRDYANLDEPTVPLSPFEEFKIKLADFLKQTFALTTQNDDTEKTKAEELEEEENGFSFLSLGSAAYEEPDISDIVFEEMPSFQVEETASDIAAAPSLAQTDQATPPEPDDDKDDDGEFSRDFGPHETVVLPPQQMLRQRPVPVAPSRPQKQEPTAAEEPPATEKPSATPPIGTPALSGVTFYGAKKGKKYRAPDADFAQALKDKSSQEQPTQIQEAMTYAKPPAKRKPDMSDT